LPQVICYEARPVHFWINIHHAARGKRSALSVILKNAGILTMIMTEIIGYVAATLTTVSFLPQAILTIKTKDTHSLSLSMYSLFTVGVLCWLVYGISISDKAIIFANAITVVLATSILSVKVYNTMAKKN
jgi:MtN3 and saliva related transmembrane protein